MRVWQLREILAEYHSDAYVLIQEGMWVNHIDVKHESGALAIVDGAAVFVSAPDKEKGELAAAVLKVRPLNREVNKLENNE